MKKILLTLSALVTPLLVGACSNAQIDISYVNPAPVSYFKGDIKYDSKNLLLGQPGYKTIPKKSGLSTNDVLDPESYKKLYNEMGTYTDVVAIAIIANHKVYTDVVKVLSGEYVWDAIKKSHYTFKTYQHPGLGIWLKTFKPKNTNNWIHGTRTDKNYNDYYPLYFINHKYAQFGVSNWKVSSREVYEITFDGQ